MKCSYCNAPLSEDAVFCPECGQKVEYVQTETVQSAFCPECGMPLLEGDVFCGNCGTRVEMPAEEKVKPAKKRNFGKIAAIGLAVIVVVAAAWVCLKLIGTKSSEYVGYIADKETYISQLPKLAESVQLTNDLCSDSDTDNEDLADAGYEIEGHIQLTAEGKKIFYPDKVNDDGYTLYYRDLTRKKSEPVKIDSDLDDYYCINENGTLVTYIKNENLYQHNLSEKKKIASDVWNFGVSEDGKDLVYLRDYDWREGGTLYMKKGNKDGEKIASDVTSLVYYNDDLSLVMYKKDDALYRVVKDGDPEKISSDVYSVYTVFESGAFYYSKQKEAYIDCTSVMKNDKGDDGKWYMDMLSGTEMDNPVKSLIYFDGKESNVITDAMVEYISRNDDVEGISYKALESGELPAVKLSDVLDNGYDVESLLEETIEKEAKTYVTYGVKAVDLNMEDVQNVKISDKNTVFVSSEYDEDDNTYSVHKLTVSNDTVKNKELLDDEVWSIGFYDGGTCLYFKDVKDRHGELYVNGKKIDDDVYVYGKTYDAETGSLYYIKDYDTDDEAGTLRYWDGKNAVTVAEEVYSYEIVDDGQLLYLSDYNLNRYKGELYRFNKQKSSKGADDVVYFFVIES